MEGSTRTMKLFLFDFDGVLMESLDVYEKTVTLCLEKISKPLTRGREEFLELFEGNFYESLTKRGVDLQEFMAASGDLLAKINYNEIKPVLAMEPVLQEMKKKNILLLISSNDSPTIKEVLSRAYFDNFFQEILGSDFMLSKKDKILYAVNKFRIASADIYYIGDTTGDIMEGKLAGVRTVGVTWGWHSKERMFQAKPDYLFDRPLDLLQLNQ
jgi:phosphoglycolate phosphatase